MYRPISFLLVALLLTHPWISVTAESTGVRGPIPLLLDPQPPAISNEDIGGERRVRTFHDQPPIIPHSILNYRIDIRLNECLSCHNRAGTSELPLTSDHFLDRDGRALASVAAGHYFCTQCHVSQAEVSLPVGNTYRVLATLPFQRHVCTECHLPQIGISGERPSLQGDDDHGR
jgi:cytochrome c-type protein NapB